MMDDGCVRDATLLARDRSGAGCSLCSVLYKKSSAGAVCFLSFLPQPRFPHGCIRSLQIFLFLLPLLSFISFDQSSTVMTFRRFQSSPAQISHLRGSSAASVQRPSRHRQACTHSSVTLVEDQRCDGIVCVGICRPFVNGGIRVRVAVG